MRSNSYRRFAALLVLIVGACSPTVPEPSAVPSAGTPSLATQVIDTPPSPAPTATPAIALDELRPRPRQVPNATVVCDAYPDQYGNEFGRTSIHCDGDLVRLTASVVQRVTDAQIERLYLDRPECPVAPCTPEQLNIVMIHVWTAAGAWTVRLDYLAGSVSSPAPTVGDPWPAAETTPEPGVERPEFPEAPVEVRTRAALPFCGRTKNTRPFEFERCFRDAVLDGRPAEMIDVATPIDFGGRTLYIWRFDGSGAMTQYARYDGAWSRGKLVMILNPPGSFNSISLQGTGEGWLRIS